MTSAAAPSAKRFSVRESTSAKNRAPPLTSNRVVAPRKSSPPMPFRMGCCRISSPNVHSRVGSKATTMIRPFRGGEGIAALRIAVAAAQAYGREHDGERGQGAGEHIGDGYERGQGYSRTPVAGDARPRVIRSNPILRA